MPTVRRTRLFKSACDVCLVAQTVVLWSRDVSGEHTVEAGTASTVNRTPARQVDMPPHCVYTDEHKKKHTL